MHAQLTIRHDSGDMIALLNTGIWTDDRTVVAASLVFGPQPTLWNQIELAATTASYRLLCWRDSAQDLQLVIESIGGNIRGASQTVWDEVRRLGEPLNPHIANLELTDEATNETLASATTGLVANLLRYDVAVGVGSGLATLVLVGCGALWFARRDAAALTVGATPALATAAILLLIALSSGWRGRLVWHA